ncbi:PREDICTED: vomeronasal type-2 receptor 26-like [Nanorana parkeri]|uniref:vomeronasal type-2 receptor 26-like n=1 Tax=Nanorana parkeri TaxID=125878 RepID=UPI0008543FFF|nr:PREDICTED: vomeronasal type-2 receptor 26-like [Nanorana parkeri]
MAPTPPCTHTALRASPPRFPHSEGDDAGSRASSPSPTRERSGHKELQQKIDRMLQRALHSTSKQITEKLTKEICDLGHRIAELESKMDNAVVTLNTHDGELDIIKDENLQLMSKLENLENRSCRSDLRIRVFSESVTDLQAFTMALLQELASEARVVQLHLRALERPYLHAHHNSNGSATPQESQTRTLMADSTSRMVPVSRCSDPCLPGSRKKFGSSIHECCYDCIPCPEGEISNIPDSENCMKCSDEEWPNEKKDRCVPKLMEFLSYTDDTIVAVFSAVSILCCLLTGVILGMFIHYQDTPIVKANNRNLSYLLLVSIMLSFLCVFLFLGHPVDVTCMLRVTSFGVIFSVAVSSLLAKSIMVCIAFKATKPGSSWRKWMGIKLPNSIMSVLSMVQVIICVTWLSISPPFQDRDTHSYQGKIIIQCNEGSVIGFYSVLGYMGLLAAVSFIIAFLARTLPDSFNEAKYITFSMLVFCSVWIAMIPAYLSTRGKYMVAVEIFAIMASSTGLLGCIFFPKCYIILFRRELNTKSGLLENRG